MAELIYEVCFKGVASVPLRSAFDDCTLLIAPGRTVVRCNPRLLHDVLDRLQSFGLELLDLHLVAGPEDERRDSPGRDVEP